MRPILLASMALLLATACLMQQNGGNASQSKTATQAQSSAPPASTPGMSGGSNFSLKLFRGDLGGHFVEMKLSREGENLSGAYSYDGIGQSLTLKGRIDPQGKLTLQEFDTKGKQTGKFDCQYSERSDESPNATIEGKWAQPDGSKETFVHLDEQSAEFTNNLKIVPKTITTGRDDIRATYPQITGSGGQGIEAFNRRVAALVEKAIKEFTDGEPEPKKSSYETNYNVLLATDDLVSVEINEDSYAGGAHPNSTHYALAYDLRAGREMQLDALFKPGSDYKKAIRDYSLKDIKERMKRESEREGNKQAEQDDSAPWINEVWTGWAMSRKGIFVYYDLAHAIAFFDRVFIPYSALKERMKRESEREGNKQAEQDDSAPWMNEEWTGWAMSRKGIFVYYDLAHAIAFFDRVFIPYSALKDLINPSGPAAAFANDERSGAGETRDAH